MILALWLGGQPPHTYYIMLVWWPSKQDPAVDNECPKPKPDRCGDLIWERTKRRKKKKKKTVAYTQERRWSDAVGERTERSTKKPT